MNVRYNVGGQPSNLGAISSQHKVVVNLSSKVSQYVKITKDQSTLEKTEGQIRNEQSRDTVNIGYTKHQTKTNKNHNTDK